MSCEMHVPSNDRADVWSHLWSLLVTIMIHPERLQHRFHHPARYSTCRHPFLRLEGVIGRFHMGIWVQRIFKLERRLITRNMSIPVHGCSWMFMDDDHSHLQWNSDFSGTSMNLWSSSAISGTNHPPAYLSLLKHLYPGGFCPVQKWPRNPKPTCVCISPPAI